MSSYTHPAGTGNGRPAHDPLLCGLSDDCPGCVADRVAGHGDAWEHHADGDDDRGGAHEPPEDPPPTEIGILLSTVRALSVAWLWPARIPLAKLTILDGDPGLGKSVLTADLAARVSRGMAMPDGATGAVGDAAGVVLLSAEDGLEDTIVPRLDAAGADRSRIVAITTVPAQDGSGQRAPVLPLDVPYIRAAVGRVGAALIIVDPLMAYLAPDVNAHRDADVRRALVPLVQLAEHTGAAVLVVRHLNKGNAPNPLYRGGGSIGIIGAARSGLLVARDPDNADRRVLASTKCNLARLPPALGFALDSAPSGALRIGWTGASSHTAETLLAAPRDDGDRGELQGAVDVLREILADGPMPAADVQAEARRAGVSAATLRRAKDGLRVVSRKTGGTWTWYLPAHAP
jgi:hypothetical protein